MIDPEDRLYKDGVLVRFEDGKLSVAGGKAAHGGEGLDILEALEQRGIPHLLIVLGKQDRLLLLLVHPQVIDQIGEVGLEEQAFTALAAFLDLPYTETLTYCSEDGELDPESYKGNVRGFDPAAIYKTYDGYANDSERR